MDIENQYDEIARCNRCGFCQVACPVFRATGHEAGVARGRIALLRALIEKRVEWDRQLEEPLFACLLCGACTANCFPAVATADLVLDARSEYLERVGRNRLHRLLFKHLLPHPRRLRLAARAAALGKRSGLSRVAAALGLLRIFGRDFPRAEQIVDRFPEQAFREQVKPGTIEGKGTLRIGYFVGCGTDLLFPDVARSTLALLCELGSTVEVLDNCCCGLPPLTYGDRAAARDLAAKNLPLVAGDRFDAIVTDCSSCAAFLKKYPTLFEPSDPLHKPAQACAERVCDLSQLLTSAGGTLPGGGLPADWREKPIVTYHDPCHASRGQGLVEEPREILRSIPGLEYRELPEADWCCGGAGSYAVAHYDLSQQVLQRKIDNVQRSGAEVLVTSCPACIVQLSHGIRKRGLAVRVCHLSELTNRQE
ncbi:MAG: (Fe-S)-binding protein [Candidatus Nealsonbacteria bacterium]|nr:(Fe-S)-binding protein [Candidatus Nealsonbacteria bacterium]